MPEVVKTRLNNLVGRLLRKLGFEMKRIPAPARQTQPKSVWRGRKLDVGCGPSPREGFSGCDIRRLPNVELVCCAWEVSKYAEDLEAIYSRHTLEHLTSAEAQCALNDWFEALAVYGTVEIIVRDLDFDIEQWRNTDEDSVDLSNQRSDGVCGFAGLYGRQRECDPRRPNYNQNYWDVHKSGYTARRLTRLLRDAGFAEIQTSIIDRCHLSASAIKITRKGERQVAADLSSVRDDHKERYHFATRKIPPGARIADMACGVGYGTHILASDQQESDVSGFDLDPGAIDYAKTHYSDPNSSFAQRDLMTWRANVSEYEAVVSFETIEHLPDAPAFLKNVRQCLSAGGYFLCSTPNEDVLKFDPKHFPYHERHYTPIEFAELLREAGFTIEEKWTQKDRSPGMLSRGWDGMYNIAVCKAH